MKCKGVKEFNSILLRIICVIVIAMTVIFAALNFGYNLTALGDVFELSSFTNQHIYQKSMADSGMLPDAYVRELIRYRNVTIPFEIKPYEAYSDQAEADRGANFSQKYYVENNYARYFEAYSRGCSVDSTLPVTKKVRLAKDDGSFVIDSFTDMGVSNDMLRYSFMLNNEGQRESAYFWYSWYYYSFAVEKDRYGHVYVLKNECEAATELTAIWGSWGDVFIMPSDYYNENYRQMFDEYEIEEVSKK